MTGPEQSPSGGPTPASPPPCAAHPNAPSTGTCGRCGNFLCPRCVDILADHDDWCAACRERAGGNKMPWEREEGSALRRWWDTTRAMFSSPGMTFERTEPGSLKKALSFNALVGLIYGAVMAGLLGLATVGLLALPGDAARDLRDPAVATGVFALILLAVPLGGVLGSLLAAAVRAGVFYLATQLCGGGGEARTALWATSYLGAAQLALLPLQIVQQIPLLGPFLGLLGYLFFEVYFALQLTKVAERYCGLTQGKAVFAGWAGFLVLAALMMSCCLFGALLAVADF
jgi:hypothetical protein